MGDSDTPRRCVRRGELGISSTQGLRAVSLDGIEHLRDMKPGCISNGDADPTECGCLPRSRACESSASPRLARPKCPSGQRASDRSWRYTRGPTIPPTYG